MLLSHFSHVWLCATPQTAAHQVPRPWDSPGKDTGVGSHFLLQCMKVKWSHSVVSNSSRSHGLQPTRLLCPWDFPGKSTGVGCHYRLWIRSIGYPKQHHKINTAAKRYLIYIWIIMYTMRNSASNVLPFFRHWNKSCSVMSDSLWPYGLYSLWNSPDQNTRVGSLALLQGIFPIQGSNSCLPHCWWILCQLSHKGSPFRHWICVYYSIDWQENRAKKLSKIRGCPYNNFKEFKQ